MKNILYRKAYFVQDIFMAWVFIWESFVKFYMREYVAEPEELSELFLQQFLE